MSTLPKSEEGAQQLIRGNAGQAIVDLTEALKDTGLANLPSANFAINAAWMQLVLVAHDLFAWTKLLCLDGELAHAEPKRLRYTLLHAAGIIVRGGRRQRLRIAAGWPWTDQLVNAFTRVHTLTLRI